MKFTAIRNLMKDFCSSVVYWPSTRPNMPFQRRGSCIFYWLGRAWQIIGDRVKIPRYRRRLMHRKRVTCELHDSYFRLMTIKHAIPKTAEVTHSDGEILSGRLNYYITRWRQEVSKFGERSVLVTSYGRESQHLAEWAPGPLVEKPWRTRKTQRLWP